MKFWFQKEEKKTFEVNTESELFSTFSTPFGKVGKGDLAAPYIRSYGSESFCRFGNDNLYPQLINQMYYKSPLNGSIINFKTNAVIGGGFNLISNDTSAEQKIKEYTFIKRNKFKKLMRQFSKDLIMHGRVCVIIDPSGKDVRITRVGPEMVRNNWNKTIYTVSTDWSRSIDMVEYQPYNPTLKDRSMWVYEIDGDAGQEIYPLPQYISASNWFFIDGEMSYLQKSNMINSIFPSFMITLAKKFKTQEEKDEFVRTVNNAKGAPEAGRIMTFVADLAEQLPNITAIPTNTNDKLFTETTEAIQSNIAFAHSIDPLLMGIRVSGKLGSGNDIAISYQIFEKNVVMPLREMMTEIGDELLSIGGINATIEINNYQIIDNVIVDKTDETKNNTI
jgi:hypothetical protein